MAGGREFDFGSLLAAGLHGDGGLGLQTIVDGPKSIAEVHRRRIGDVKKARNGTRRRQMEST